MKKLISRTLDFFKKKPKEEPLSKPPEPACWLCILEELATGNAHDVKKPDDFKVTVGNILDDKILTSYHHYLISTEMKSISFKGKGTSIVPSGILYDVSLYHLERIWEEMSERYGNCSVWKLSLIHISEPTRPY